METFADCRCPGVREGWAVVSEVSGTIYTRHATREDAEHWLREIQGALWLKGQEELSRRTVIVQAPAAYTRVRCASRHWGLAEYPSPAWVEFPEVPF